MANSKINVTNLDFDQIKNNLKAYLQGQSEFADYNFEGSALSTLLDLLAYNTHYDALYYNLAINESFLDSASKRSSVVSKATEIGYVPKSITSSSAIINLIMVNNSLTAPDVIEMARYTPFSTTIDGVSYTFYTTETHLATRNGATNTYTLSNVTIREGYPLTYRYVIDSTNTTQLTIPNSSVDMSTLRVMVQDNAETSDFVTFLPSDTILNVGPASKVFFTKELSSGQYQLQFGNGVIGQALRPGNIVTLEYFASKGPLANGARVFTYAGQPLANTSVNTITVASSAGGADPESIENIRFNAPRLYATHNRCVTADDYKSTIMALYPTVKSVNVWGGEDNTPPSYGAVYISPVSQNGLALTESDKANLLSSVINPRKPITTRVIFVDPDFLEVDLNVSFYYDPNLTTKTSSDLTKLVQDTIIRYNDQYLNMFSGILKYSMLSRLIDNSDSAIISNIMTLKSRVYFSPIYNVVSNYQVSLDNPIFNSGIPDESILSSGVVTDLSPEVCYFDDVPIAGTSTGNIRLFYVQNNIKTIVNPNVGTIDYSTGMITISNINIISSIEDRVSLTVKTQSNDVVSAKNRIVSIDLTKLKITPIVQTNFGDYQFTSSRN